MNLNKIEYNTIFMLKINKVPMENNGQIGSQGGHLERTIFGDETMVAEDTKDAKFTKISLSIALDSGWYQVDLSKGEHYFWGKNEGCDFIQDHCSVVSADEFCSEDTGHVCSDNFMYRSQCQKTSFTDDCMLNLHARMCKKQHEGSFYETYGENSMCQKLEVYFFCFTLSKI